MDQEVDLTGIYRAGEPRRSASAITFHVEPKGVDMVRQEGLDLIERHYDEIAQFKTVQKLDPDWETYNNLERAGRLWVLSARADGVLIGYIVMVVFRNLHYKNLLMATEDIHFIAPEYRKGLTGYRLLARMKKEMQAKGVGMIITRTKASQSHAALFERLGGHLQDLVYAIVL